MSPVERAPRLAIVITALTAGGAERVTALMAGHFAALGWPVTLVTLGEAADDFYPVDPRVERVALGVAGASGHPARALFNNGRRAARLRRCLRALRAEVVLAMTTEIAALTLLATVALGCRVVVSEHIHPPMLRIGSLWHWLRLRLYPRADTIVVLTAESRRWMQRHIPRARTAVIPNWVEMPLPVAEPVVEPDAVVPADAALLLAVGRFAPQKNFACLLDAFARIAPGHPHWQLAILGDGELRTDLLQRIQALGLSGRVHLPGRVGNGAAWYRRAGLFVLSSNFEGFPVALTEALAHGCPAVSFDCPTGPADIIRDGVDGLLVRPVADATALAAALGTLMDDADRRRLMADEAPKVANRFAKPPVMATWASVLAGDHAP